MTEHTQVKTVQMNYDKDRPKAENPLQVEDISLRDGHQSLFATCHKGQNRRHDSRGRAHG